jgi:nucleoside-diphosphate-sugar epimerase
MPVEAQPKGKISIVGGSSSIGTDLRPLISKFAPTLTAGRAGCDIFLDLAAPWKVSPSQKGLMSSSILRPISAAVRARANHTIFIPSTVSSLTGEAESYPSYSLSKRHAEEFARAYCFREGMPLTILKPSQVSGNQVTFQEHQPLLYGILDAGESQAEIHIHGTHVSCKNFIHIDDLTAVILRVIQARPTRTYVCAHPENSTCLQIAKAALRSFENNGNISFLSSEPSVPDTIFEVDSSLYNLLELYPQISIEEGIERLAYFRNTTP